MIKAIGVDGEGTPMFVMILNGENVARLLADEPIMVDLSEGETPAQPTGLPRVKVVIAYEKDTAAAMRRLQEQFGP